MTLPHVRSPILMMNRSISEIILLVGTKKRKETRDPNSRRFKKPERDLARWSIKTYGEESMSSAILGCPTKARQ